MKILFETQKNFYLFFLNIFRCHHLLWGTPNKYNTMIELLYVLYSLNDLVRGNREH